MTQVMLEHRPLHPVRATKEMDCSGSLSPVVGLHMASVLDMENPKL